MSDDAPSGNQPSNNQNPWRSPHDKMIDEVIFKRDLDEVHLLLDYISGRTDKSLNKLKILDPSDPAGEKFLSTSAVVERITQIRYPPVGDTPKKIAEDAAFLLITKDQLNGLTDPARGLTIAYSSMFVGVAHQPLFCWAWFSRSANAKDKSGDQSKHRGLTLAKEIYPAMVPHARHFQWLFTALVLLTFVWLGFTALAYWDVAFGRSILQRFDQIDKDQATLTQASPDVLRRENCDSGARADLAFACAKLIELANSKAEANKDLTGFRQCDDSSCNAWLHVTRWGFALCGARHGEQSDQALVASILSVYSNYILPMMFGLLGTMITAIRKIQDLVGRSELHPRDRVLTLLLLPMGAVAAVAVGLFFSPSGSTLSGSSSLSGDLTLTASGLGFLAGYGAAAFFTFLDNLLKQVFKLDRPPAKSPPAAAA